MLLSVSDVEKTLICNFIISFLSFDVKMYVTSGGSSGDLLSIAAVTSTEVVFSLLAVNRL